MSWSGKLSLTCKKSIPATLGYVGNLDNRLAFYRLDLTLCYGPPHKLLWVFPGSKIQPEVLAV
jgi:hypothetical protein